MASPALHEIQRALRASLVAHDDAGAAPHIVASGFSPAERLEVYRNTFASVLVNALRLSYPAVRKLVGAEFFEGAARFFIAAHPPVTACLDDYGDAFPEFLAGFERASSLPYLPEVARLERAVCRALHAPDAERALLRLRYPVDLIWRAVLGGDDAALAAIDLASGPALLLVDRRDDGVEVARLPEPEWRFASALSEGRSLHAALEAFLTG